MKNTMFKKALAIFVGMIVIAASLVGVVGIGAEESNIDETLAGTKENGITSHNGDGMVNVIVDGLYNTDFEDGFKWWGGKGGSGADTVMELIEEDGNTYAKYKADYTGAWKGIATPAFKVPEDKIEVGDQLVVIYDALPGEMGDVQHGTCVLRQYYADGSAGNFNQNYRLGGGTYDNIIGAKNGWAVCRTKFTNLVKARSEGTHPGSLSSGYYLFGFQIECPNEGSTLAVDNFRLAKFKNNKYYDVFTGEEYTFTFDKTPILQGSAEEGFYRGGGYYLPPAMIANMYNGTFENGLVGWGPTVNAQQVSDWKTTNIVQLKEENGNKYIQFDGDNGAAASNGNTDYVGIMADFFPLDDTLISDGDQLVITFKYKNGDGSNLQWILEMSNGGGRVTQTYKDDIKQEGDWYIGYTAPIKGIPAKAAGEVARYFMMILECNGAANGQTEIAVDDIQVCKLSADGNKFYDVYTGELVYDITPVSDGGNSGGDNGGNNSGSGTGTGTGTGGSNTGTGTGNGTGSGTGSNDSATTGDSVLLLVALLFVCGTVTVVCAKRFAKVR